MGFRFQKRVRLGKFVTLNLSKSGVSTSVGVRGARVTLGHGKTRTTVGIPGTGVSYTEVSKSSETKSSESDSGGGSILGGVLLLILLFLIAGLVSKLTS